MKTRALVWMMNLLALIPGVSGAQSICGTWTHSPTPNPNAMFSQLLGVAAIAPNDIWAVGEYDSLAGTYTPMLRSITTHWDGAAWTTFPSPAVGPSGTTLTAVAGAASNAVWAVGYSNTYGTPQTLVQKWDGTHWSVVASPVITGGSSLEAVTLLTPTDLWSVGNRAGGLPQFNTSTASLTVHFNGTSWVAVPSPNVGNRWNDLVAVSGTSANDVWAVGCWRDIGGLFQNLAMHWNGASWSVVATPNVAGAENQLQGVVAISSNDAWAAGRVNDGISERAIFLHWNGASWTVVPGPGGSVNGGSGLVALASNDVWAVGSTVSHWDGSSWSLAPNPQVPDASGVALQSAARLGPCDVWAVGIAIVPSGQHTLATHLTAGGGTINQPPVAVTSATPVSGLAPLHVQLSSAGSHDPDGTIVSYLWDFGDSSYPLNRTEANPEHTYIQSGPLTYHASLQIVDDHGAVATSSVTIHIDDPMHVESQLVTRAPQGNGWRGEDAITVNDGSGYPMAGANVTASYSGPSAGTVSGTTDAAGAVALKTSTASAAGSGWCFTVTGITATGAGYVPGDNVVTTQCESGSTDVPPGNGARTFALTAGPNPFRDVASIQLALPAASVVAVDVLDATGRLVRSLLHDALPPGMRQIAWDGRDAGGVLAPAGLYFVRATTADERRIVRLLRLR